MEIAFYRKVEQGKALIVSSPNNVEVSFTGKWVPPLFRKVEIMDISLNAIEIDRRGSEGLICQDNIRADIKVVFFVRVNKTTEDVVRVAQTIGCERASDKVTLEELFSAKFSEALKTVGKQLDFVDLYTKREEFRDQIIEVIGRDLNGYILEDAAIDYLEQTPMTALDANNILDAQGIRKITELTAHEHVKTNEFQNFERKLITKQDVEAREAILELERQQADAEARQAREVATVRAREEAEIAKVQSEEYQRAETARISTQETLEVQEQNKLRQVQVAEKNRERVLAVEIERVEKERALEAIAREREVELQRIEKEKELEVERKAIADVIRDRLSVEKTQAEEEEGIKALRVVEAAKRNKEATIIAAEAQAEEQLVKNIKQAEADEQAAVHKAQMRLTLAEAELESSDKVAQAKIRMAEGIQAEQAAAGLADVRVKEADAAAIEKVGLAEARVTLERMQAEAQGTERGADALRKEGLAKAEVQKQMGLAEAEATRVQLAAEASGIEEKAKAMQALDDASRGHEEFRIKLETARKIELESIEAQKAIAEAQAAVLSQALQTANIDIVGGDDMFVDKLVNAISTGKSVDRMVGKSETVQHLLADYLDGTASLPGDLKDILTRANLDTSDVQNLTVSALLMRLMSASDDAGQGKLQQLLASAQELGIEDLELG